MTSHLKELSAVSATAISAEYEQHGSDFHTSGRYRDYVKRPLDIALILLVAPIVFPIVLMFSLLVCLDGGSPFYRQRRVGRNGLVFDMLKIRTMVPGAKEKLEEYLASNPTARAEWDRDQKLKNDPRITPIGKILRKSSLDELPQLWNVLKGDMSIVGPRPMMEDQKALYPGRSYYAMRPGITGAWQVSDRNQSTFAARAKFDNDYYNQLSLRTDVSILVKTVSVVLRCTGY